MVATLSVSIGENDHLHPKSRTSRFTCVNVAFLPAFTAISTPEKLQLRRAIIPLQSCRMAFALDRHAYSLPSL
ncbi:hypothetical protein TcWFU_007676 [Taenia crassiceps]|uniref:Uncharacterized protein n=1 Tax=Taenia crassiceps TaxID=6207 RepID=A0ABR4QM83_9CEST